MTYMYISFVYNENTSIYTMVYHLSVCCIVSVPAFCNLHKSFNILLNIEVLVRVLIIAHNVLCILLRDLHRLLTDRDSTAAESKHRAWLQHEL